MDPFGLHIWWNLNILRDTEKGRNNLIRLFCPGTDYPELSEYRLKQSMPLKIIRRFLSGSSGSPWSPKKSPSHICIFRPVIIKYSEKPGIQSFQELFDPGFDQEWIIPIFNNRCFA